MLPKSSRLWIFIKSQSAEKSRNPILFSTRRSQVLELEFESMELWRSKSMFFCRNIIRCPAKRFSNWFLACTLAPFATQHSWSEGKCGLSVQGRWIVLRTAMAWHRRFDMRRTSICSWSITVQWNRSTIPELSMWWNYISNRFECARWTSLVSKSV